MTTYHRLYRYNGKTLDNFLYSTKPEYNLGSSNQFILDILQDRKGNLWFSSWNDTGVWFYDGRIFTNFSEKNGLVNNSVMSILKDNSGNIWLGTKYFGLSRYDGKTFTTFSRQSN